MRARLLGADAISASSGKERGEQGCGREGGVKRIREHGFC